MPGRVVTVKLWGVVFSFVVVTAAYVLSLTWTDRISHRTQRLSHDTQQLAVENTHRIAGLRRLAARNSTALLALCALHRDLGHRLDASKAHERATKDFLRQHPNGIDGISPALLKKSLQDVQREIAGERQTLTALSVVRCRPAGHASRPQP